MVEKSNAFNNNSKNIKRIKYSVFPCLLGVEFGRQIPKQILAKDFKYRDLIIKEFEQFGQTLFSSTIRDKEFIFDIEIFDYFKDIGYGSEIDNYQEVILETELGDVSLRYYHWSAGVSPSGLSWYNGEDHSVSDEEICFANLHYDDNGTCCVTDKTGIGALILADIAYKYYCKKIGSEEYNTGSLVQAYNLYKIAGGRLFDRAFDVKHKYINNLGIAGVYFKVDGERIRLE